MNEFMPPRNYPKSDVVRERLPRSTAPAFDSSTGLNLIADLIGSVDCLPANLSKKKKRQLKTTGYGKNRAH